MGEPPRTIPFGSLIDEISEHGSRATFVYLGELYECGADLLRSALSASNPGTTTPSSRASPAAELKTPPVLTWESLQSTEGLFSRARVAGGWLVMNEAKSLAFVPDAANAW